MYSRTLRWLSAAWLLCPMTIIPQSMGAPPPVSATRADPGCEVSRSRFKGEGDLEFGAVIATESAAIPLYENYPRDCESSEGGSCKVIARMHYGDNVAIGTSCGDWTDVQFISAGTIRTGWIRSAQISPIKTVSDPSPTLNPVLDLNRRYKFQLTMGRATPVCVAYQQRLNLTVFHRPPFCGRPETNRVPGFDYLHRVRLAQSTFDRLAPVASSLFTHQPVVPLWKPNIRSKYVPSSWSYNPKIDLDNDGEADEIVVWDDEDESVPTCGLPGGPAAILSRGGQYGLVLNSIGSSIDEQRTNLLFGQLGLDAIDARHAIHPTGYDNFQPIGVAVGVFRYRGTTYFDTFFDNTYHIGAQGADKIDPNLENTLGVFLRRNGVTSQVCEYRLLGSKE